MLGMFIDLSSSSISEIVNYSKGLITDLMPILSLIVGVMIGLFVLHTLLSGFKH